MLKATGCSVAVIRFDADHIARLRREQVDHIAYHVARLLTGDPTAASEWEHLGLRIEVGPDTDGGPEGEVGGGRSSLGEHNRRQAPSATP
jgi:hypothetical protein